MHWEQARGGEGELAEQAALLAVLAREQQTCEVGFGRGDWCLPGPLL